MTIRHVLALCLALLILPLGIARAEDEAPQPPVAPQPDAEEAVLAQEAPPTPKVIDAAITRGVAWLVKHQRPDGGWGSPASTLSDIYAPVPGSQQAFRVAVSGLAVSALLEVGAGHPGVDKSIARATKWLIERHGVRRVAPNTLYNIWAHAYSLEAFARLLMRTKDAEARVPLMKAARLDIRRLATFEFVEGGWGYYNFKVRTKRPGPGSTSFTTATVMHALRMADQQGVPVPDRLVKRAVRIIERSSRPDGAFAYSDSLVLHPSMGVNKIKGSLARTPACLRALLDWSPEGAKRTRWLKAAPTALEQLEKYGHFLLIARKYPVPHETWYQNSGYFCFYGYYYATGLFPDVAPAPRKLAATQIAGHMLGLQEKDGSWWDYQLFGMHKPYGTGYILMTLGRCRDVLGAKPAQKDGDVKKPR